MIRISGLALGIMFTEQVIDIFPFHLQLPQNKFFYKIIARLLNDLLRCSKLGNMTLINDENFIRQG
ncbi:hypothetical protein D3C71_1795780 [compost metagenome]